MRNTVINRRPLIVLTVAAVGIVLIAVYGMFDPESGFFPRCPWKMLTGFDCPGCGSQRAIHALLTGHPVEACRYNMMLPLLMPYALLLILLELFPRRSPRLRAALTSQAAIWLTLLALVLWTLLRNILFC